MEARRRATLPFPSLGVQISDGEVDEATMTTYREWVNEHKRRMYPSGFFEWTQIHRRRREERLRRVVSVNLHRSITSSHAPRRYHRT